MFHTKEFTLEKSLMSAVGVGNSLVRNLSSFNTKGFTLEKSLMNAVNVENPLGEASMTVRVHIGERLKCDQCENLQPKL